ncbi:hypothetical protein SAMN04488007_3510 [Maribacter aquivivus]|uniref:Uncharacterized protein n=1 Tax=Maribacter aquivivus TaxID=228958 RepID=A0A1M6U6R4_9FLAO|nr:hypothetical protein [Maribacter aquivivus]SHK64863.1 hypothetical protein SAMN04488007_3510 [Maribacter aquivivus]
MTFKNPKSNISYKYAIVALIIIVIIIITSLVLDTQQGSDLKSMLLGILILAIAFTAVIGLGYSFMGIREPNTTKKIIGLIINSIITISLGLLFLSSVIEILPYLI